MPSAAMTQVGDKPPTKAEAALARLLPRLDAAEVRAERLQQELVVLTRALAKERGVAFIRTERVRAEFSK